MSFSINQGTGVTVAVTASSSNTALTGFATVQQVRLVNAGANVCFVRFGPVSQTAVVTDFCVRNGESVVVNLPPNSIIIGAICPSTQSTTLHVSPVVTNE
jgi:hypothetical protein